MKILANKGNIMKKLNIMLEDEPLTPRPNPVPRGLQKQFPIARTLCIVVAWFLALVSHSQAMTIYQIPIVVDDTASAGLVVVSFQNNTLSTVNDLHIYAYVWPGSPPARPAVVVNVDYNAQSAPGGTALGNGISPGQSWSPSANPVLDPQIYPNSGIYRHCYPNL
jgi:hypothetical protein